jgi:predicted metal-dependent phosphoesterase TrpH
MIIDLHVHTKRLSPCSEMDPEEAVSQAKKMELDGLCFTEHNRTWDDQDFLTLARTAGIAVFQGVEVDTSEGHVLVFGLEKHFQGITPIDKLRRMVDELGGFMVAVHPFRGMLQFGLYNLKLDPVQASENPLFKWVDDMEILSGRQTRKENDLSSQVCERLNMKGLGGSDAHSEKDIGKCVTVFEKRIEGQDALVRELKAGRFRAGYLERK